MCSKIDFIQKYFEDDGTECGECIYFLSDPPVNWYNCKILEGDIEPENCPAFPIKFIADETTKETIQELENA